MLLVSLALVAAASAFCPAPNVVRPSTVRSAATPYFLDVVTKDPPSTADKKAAAAPKHKEGLFSPIVYAAKEIMGDTELNRLRGNIISMHSNVIKSFVATAESDFGNQVLRVLYSKTDQDGNGKIEMEELEKALQVLGFNWLQEKQIKGIFKRAGGEEKGYITLEEWEAEAPKTLKTNLVKLAKSNGGDLGFLV
jgi:hypothetical protein